jgi:type IV fimbrial biogenesis protein FimT
MTLLSNKGRGFTIMELVVIMAIVAILAIIGIPTFSSLTPDLRLNSAARDLKSDMELAKMRAIRENATVAVVCNTGTESYTVFVDNGAGGGTADNWTQDGAEELVISSTMPDGIDMYEASFDGGVSRCRFDGRGLPNGLGGHIYMKNRKNKYRGIALSMVGHIQIQESTDGGSWSDAD